MSTTAQAIRRLLRERATEALQRGLQNLDFSIYRQLQAPTTVPALEGRVNGYPTEEHRLTLGVTENPVESGSTITDNAVKRPDRLRLIGRVSDILPSPGKLLRPDGPADLWHEVLDLMENKELLEVLTPIRTYRNMLITSAVTTRNSQTGRGLRFTIDFGEVLLAETSLARFPPDIVDALGPAANRTSEVDGGDRSSPAVNLTLIHVPARLTGFVGPQPI